MPFFLPASPRLRTASPSFALSPLGSSGPPATASRTASHRSSISSRGTPSLAAVATSAKLGVPRSEEHTSELQSQSNLVCRLLLEKKKTNKSPSFVERLAPVHAQDFVALLFRHRRYHRVTLCESDVRIGLAVATDIIASATFLRSR